MTSRVEHVVNSRQFWLYLLLLCAVTLLMLAGLQAWEPKLEAFSPFTILSVGVFAAIVGLAYSIGVRVARSQSKGRFVQLIMFLVLIKMMICILLVVFHVKINEPTNKLFVLPFLIVYLIFTIFEVFTLEKLARLKPENKTTNT